MSTETDHADLNPHLDNNYAPHRYVYVLEQHGMFIGEIGLVGGRAAWRQARHFQNYGAAKDARDDSTWHNTGEAVSLARIVRLEVSVTPKFFPYPETQ